MNDITPDKIMELNNVPAETTSKNTELDVFVDLLRKADSLNISNKKEDREKAIECYQKALFGDDNGFEGVFIESVFITLGQNVLAYAKHNFDLAKIENFLIKINEKIKNNQIVEDELIKIYQLTFVIDQAVKNQLTHLIEDLVEKARNKYPLPKGWDSQTESYENSYNEMYEDQISREDDNYNESSKNALYKLWMRITTYDYTKLINSSSKNQTQGEKTFIDEEKELEEKFTKLVERVFEETTTKENDIKNFNDTKKNLKRVALPFCNLVISWTNDSEYKKDNYRKAIPHLYDAINVLWSGEHENDSRYRAKSFMFKTISNVQLKRISARVEEDKMSKAREYFFKLLENLNGRTPSDKEQEYLSDKYKKDEAFKKLKDELKSSYMDILINDTNNPYRAEHRSHFFKGIIEFCNVTLNIIKGKDNLLYEQISDIIRLLAESTYQKFYTDSKDNNIKKDDIKKDANFYYQAYYCAELFYVLGDKEIIKRCITIVKEVQNDSRINREDKYKLTGLLSLLKIKLDSQDKSNLRDVINKYDCKDVYALISKGSSNEKIKDELNRQAYYDILKKVYCDNKLDNNNIEFIKDGLSGSKFSEFLIGKVISNQNTDSYRQEIAKFILRYGAKLEAIVTDQDIDGSDSMHVSDEALTLLILPLIQRTIIDIEEKDLYTLTENICNCFGSEFARDSATTHYYILELLVRTIILKNSRPIMEYLLTQMPSWRANYHIDNLILRVYINLIRNHKSTNENTDVNDFKDKLKSKCNPFIVLNFNGILTSDITLKANIDDDVYKELLSIFNNNLQLIKKTIDNLIQEANKYGISWSWKDKLIKNQGKEWNKYILNLFNIANFQYELGKTIEAGNTLTKAENEDYYKKHLSEFEKQAGIRNISVNIKEAVKKANEGLNRFKQKKDLTNWKQVIAQKRKEHSTEPVYKIFKALRDTLNNNSKISALVHSGGEVDSYSTKEYIEQIKDELDQMLADSKIPFEFGKALYDYCYSEKWKYINIKNESITEPSVTTFKTCKDIQNKDTFNGLISVNPYSLLDGIEEEKRLIPKSTKDETITFKRVGDKKTEGSYRSYIPSLRSALSHMIAETKTHTTEGKQATLWLQARYGNNDQDQKVLLIDVINPYANDINGLNLFIENGDDAVGGSVQIVKDLWGLCDFAIEKRYKNKGTWHVEHKNILGQIEDSSDQEESWPKNDDCNVMFRYIIKINEGK